MASGQAIGTVFIELDLDPSRYTKGQQQLYKDATQTALNIEENFKKLGIKSSAEFDLMRQKAQNAFEAIKNSHKVTANDIIRAEQAKADTLKRINEQQYGHHTTLIEALKKNWIAASVAITGAIMAINKAWILAESAASYLENMQQLDALAKKYDTTSSIIVSKVREISGGMISMSTAAQTGLSALTKNLEPEKIYGLAKAATVLNDSMKMTVDDAFVSMTEALEANKQKSLKLAIGVIDLKERYGDLADKMSEAEKQTAFYNLIIEKSNEIQMRVGDSAKTYADQMETLKVTISDLKIELGIGLIRAGAGAMALFQSLAAAALKLSQGIFIAVQGFYAMREGLAITDEGRKYAAGKGLEWKSYATAAGGAAGELWDKTKGNFSAMTASTADMVKAQGGGAFYDDKLSNKSGTVGKAKENKNATKEAERLAREEQKIHEIQVDFYIKEEARKWEALEKYYEEQEKLEKEYLDLLHKRAEEESKVYEKQQQGAENYRQIMAQMNIDIAEGHEKAVLQIMEDDRRMYDNITKLMDEGVISFDEAMQAWEKLAEKTGKSIQEIIKDDLTKTTEIFQKRLRSVSDSFGMLSNACMDLASIYDEGSASAKRWEEAAKTMEIAQRAVAVVQAVAAIATQGLGDPYTAFARIAAMAASMASLLATIGESVNSPSGGSSSSHLPASTVLGAEAGTKSESVSNSFEMLRDIYDIENTKLTKIYNELKDLNSNITGLVSSLVRTGGISDYSTYESTIQSSQEKNWLKLSGSVVDAWDKVNNFINFDNKLIGLATGSLIYSKITELLNKGIGWIVGNVFGGEVKYKAKEAGLSLGNTNIADILSYGANAQQYALIKKTVDGGWFGKDKTSYSTQYSPLESQVSGLFDKVFAGVGNSLVYFAESLGTNVADVLNYAFEKTKLDLKDMTAEEMNEAISGYISSASDNAVSALFGDIVGKYQELNEGLMETATRLIVDKEIVASVLEDTGKAFKGTVPEMIAFSEQLIDIAGGLDQLTEAAQSYVDKFYTDAEKFASTKQSIRDVAGILPRTRDDYRRLVESIDLTSEVGKQAYYTLLALSDTADGYYSHLEDLANQRAEMEIQLLEAQGKTAEALAASRKRELAAMDESLRPLQELIWLTQDLGTQLETVTTSVTTEINALISTSSSAASQARSMANTYKNLIETLEEAQVKIFGGGKAGAQIRLNDIYGKAMTGDADAIGKMPAAIDTLLNESLASAHTLLEYRRDQAKSYIALENAQKVSTSMMNWEEYQATLLETQTKVLELIRDDIQSNNYAELQKHSELLGNIGTLLETSNAVTLTGNATQDVIKNLDAINTSYTAEMLTELVSGGTSQTNSLLSILSSSQTVVTLLGQLLSVFQANEQAIAQKEIEMSKAEYNTALSDTSAALASLEAARSATRAAEEIANIEGSQYLQAQQVAGWAASLYQNNPTAANKADMDKYLSIANTEYSQYAAAQANLNTATAQEKAALSIYNETLSTAAQLKEVTNALIDVYNAQYPTTPIQKFAYGGIATGSESGYEATLHGTELVVSPKSKYPATVKSGDNSELLSELKSLNAKLDAYGSSINKYSEKTYKVLDKFDRDGLPEERAA